MATPAPSKRYWLTAVWLLAFVAAMLAVWLLLRESNFWQFISSPQTVRAWVVQWGAAAPLVFFGLQVLQVVIFVIPGETFQIAGGYLFGFWIGLALTVTGIAAGSAVNFFAARLLGRPLVERFFPKEQIDKLSALTSGSRAQVGFFFLFVIPGIPKDILCYVAGLSHLRFGYFLIVSTLGRLPGILGSTLMGSSAASEKWLLSAILLVAAVVLFGVGYLLRERVHVWIDSMAHRREQ